MYEGRRDVAKIKREITKLFTYDALVARFIYHCQRRLRKLYCESLDKYLFTLNKVLSLFVRTDIYSQINNQVGRVAQSV
jgi:hypothetical protein